MPKRITEPTPKYVSELLRFSILEQFTNTLQHGVSNRHTEHLQFSHVQAEQIHGNAYAWVTSTTQNVVPGVDALITRHANIRLRIGVSDCAPIIIYNPVQQQVSVIHAGFKGTSQEILTRVLNEFEPATTYVGIGPAIQACCYNNIDIQTENVMQALSAGVPSEHIEVIDLCTKHHNDDYFSYRGGDTTNFGIYAHLI